MNLLTISYYTVSHSSCHSSVFNSIAYSSPRVSSRIYPTPIYEMKLWLPLAPLSHVHRNLLSWIGKKKLNRCPGQYIFRQAANRVLSSTHGTCSQLAHEPLIWELQRFSYDADLRLTTARSRICMSCILILKHTFSCQGEGSSPTKMEGFNPYLDFSVCLASLRYNSAWIKDQQQFVIDAESVVCANVQKFKVIVKMTINLKRFGLSRLIHWEDVSN